MTRSLALIMVAIVFTGCPCVPPPPNSMPRASVAVAP